MKVEKTKIKFIDIKKCGFITEPRYYFYGWSKTSKIMGRESSVKALVRARKLLPKGYAFKIWDCKRSYVIQELMMASFLKRLNLLYQSLSIKERKKLLLRFSGGLVKKIKRLDTHRNGGSFDLTIIDQQGIELYMGTDLDDLTEKAATDYYEKKSGLSLLEREAKKNRQLLKRVLEKAGFVNYALEWWHWSYDK
ncbi:MAG: M15 family metallopeptidase [Patescibacteria group bacterium]